jgi:hypothetical protein
VGATELEIADERLRVNVKDAGARDRTLEELRDALVPNAIQSPSRISDVASVTEREALTIHQPGRPAIRAAGDL